MSKFRATQNGYNNGFHMTFENGYTMSVQFGKGNYSDQGETTAEVAAWGPDGEWVKLCEYDDVKGWCSPDEVLKIMNMVASKGKKKMSTFEVLRLAFYITLIITAVITLIVIA